MKGQAVMEYLITYGLALFVILIVLGILVAVVLPSIKPPELCQFTQPGFGCSSKTHALVSNAANEVRLIFQLDNEKGRTIEVKDVLCTTKSTSSVSKADFDLAPSRASVILASGQGKSFGTGSGDFSTVPCYDDTGNPVILPPGSSFRGAVAILYSFTDDIAGAPDRIAVASVAGTVQAE